MPVRNKPALIVARSPAKSAWTKPTRFHVSLDLHLIHDAFSVHMGHKAYHQVPGTGIVIISVYVFRPTPCIGPTPGHNCDDGGYATFDVNVGCCGERGILVIFGSKTHKISKPGLRGRYPNTATFTVSYSTPG